MTAMATRAAASNVLSCSQTRRTVHPAPASTILRASWITAKVVTNAVVVGVGKGAANTVVRRSADSAGTTGACRVSPPAGRGTRLTTSGYSSHLPGPIR